ncbi:MAG TPA: helix-turn-helix domain-containing protein [Terriglobales bacterium]
MESTQVSSLHLGDGSVLTPAIVPQHPRRASTDVPPSHHELQRLIERRRAQELDIELPLTIIEAADYVGLLRCEIEELAYAGLIPVHRVSSAQGGWVFYPSELDEWLRSAVQDGGADASSRI